MKSESSCLFLLKKWLRMYAQGAPWNRYLSITDMFQAIVQNTTAISSHPVVSTIPISWPIVSNHTPIIAGDGKSPKACMKNTDIALAWPLSRVGTQFMMAMATGEIVMKTKNCAIVIPKKYTT